MTILGKKLIQHYESLHDGDLSVIGLQPKMDTIGYWTEGYGRLMIDPKTNRPIRGILNKKRAYELQSIHDEAEALAALDFDLMPYEKAVMRLVSIELEAEQISALTSFSYNVGIGDEQKLRGGFAGSSLRNAINRRANDGEIRRCFRMWNKADGTVYNGLIYRRESEADLFIKKVLVIYDKEHKPKM